MWKKLKELGFGRILVNNPDFAGTGSVFQRKADDLWDMKKVVIPKLENISSEYEEYELCYNRRGRQYQYKVKDADETKDKPQTIKFHIGRVYTTFLIDGVLERFTTPHEVSDILFETAGKNMSKLTLDKLLTLVDTKPRNKDTMKSLRNGKDGKSLKEKPQVSSNVFKIAQNMPAIEFNDVSGVLSTDRDRSPWKILLDQPNVVMDVGMGAGKSHAIREYLEKVNNAINSDSESSNLLTYLEGAIGGGLSVLFVSIRIVKYSTM